MTRTLLLAALTLSCAAALPAQSPTTLDPVAIWERMIAAKGGRERLRDVHTFVVAVDGKVAKNFRRRDVIAKEDLETVVALPDRGWTWADHRPGHMGFSVAAWDANRRVEWLADNGGPAKSIEWEIQRETFRRRIPRELQLLYFFETAYLRPVLLGASAVAKNRVQINVQAEGFALVRYLVDMETFLPIEVTLDELLPTPGRTYRSTYTLAGVVTVTGLQMPRRVDGEDVRFTINPDIDPKLFEMPPDGVKSRDAWKKFLRK